MDTLSGVLVMSCDGHQRKDQARPGCHCQISEAIGDARDDADYS